MEERLSPTADLIVADISFEMLADKNVTEANLQ
jgi:hypothetical protein